jgi:hypothetical protein
MTRKELNIRQKRWIDLIMDFDCVIDYHPGKANVVVDALSHKNKSIMETIKENDKRELIKLKKIDAKIELGPEGSLLAQLKV